MTTLALALFCVCCAKESTQTSKTADSTTIAESVAAAAATVAASAPPSVAPTRLNLDTAIPAMSLDTMPWTDTRELFDTTESAPAFQCAPHLFTPADTVTLRIAVPHAVWLKVRRPDETVFDIVAPPAPGQPNYSVVPSDSFANRLVMRFSGDMRSRPLLAGHDGVEPIFGQPGRYTFMVGDYSQSDRGRDVRECMIKLVPLSRY
jgi:hypothetical protein